MTALDAAFDRFVARLRARLVAGAATYGDVSFMRPLPTLVDEVMEELEDTAGWALILWTRLEQLRGRVEVLDQGAADEPR